MKAQRYLTFQRMINVSEALKLERPEGLCNTEE